MKNVAAIAIAALAIPAARRYLAGRRAVAEVPKELRSPILTLLPHTVSTRTLSIHRLFLRIPTKTGRGVVMATRTVGDPAVKVRVITPDAGAVPRPAVLWIHGGGMIAGSPQLEAFDAARIARDLGVVVVMPDYRLAPENAFPAALDDCMMTLNWMRDSADELGIDPERIAVMGASAGGGLSAAVAQRSYDEGNPPRAQVLLCPMIDDRTVLRTAPEGRGRLIWTPSSNRFAWTSYLGRHPRLDAAPKYAAPARRSTLAGLPPAWVGVGDLDLFYDESVAYAESLRSSGVQCELVTVPGMYHGAEGLAPKSTAVQNFRLSVDQFLRTHLVANP